MRSVREGLRVNLFAAQTVRCRTKPELVERGSSDVADRGREANVVLVVKWLIVIHCHDEAVRSGRVGRHKPIWPRLS